MELRKYIRDRHGHPIGVVLSNAKNSVGWSLCARSHGDHFDYAKGIMIAQNREAAGYDPDKVPQSLKNDFTQMLERSRHYFK